MSWEDPRGGGLRVAARGGGMVVHHEQAKSKKDESQGLRTHRSGRRWLVGAGAAGIVLVLVVVVMLATRGNSGEPAAAAPRSQASGSTAPSSSASPIAATPVVTVADTVPQGRYAVKTVTRSTQRDGTHPAPERTSARWTFKAGSCTTATCPGTLVSSSGATYSYVWDGRTLTLTRAPLKTDRQGCVTPDGTVVPISESSYIATYTYDIPPVTVTVTDAPPASIKGTYSYTIAYRNFGNCQDTPGDVVSARATFSASRGH